MSVEDRKRAARAEARALDAKYEAMVEGWEDDREQSAAGMLERVDDPDPHCECGRAVDFVNQQCPTCHRQYLAELGGGDE